MVTFRLQKLTLLLILGLVGLAGALTFSAGMVVGVHWTLSSPALEAMFEGRAVSGTPGSSRAMAAVNTTSPGQPAAETRPVADSLPKPAGSAFSLQPRPAISRFNSARMIRGKSADSMQIA